MLVRVKLLGSGTKTDPFRPGLPNFDDVLSLHEQGIVYALIPESEHPKIDEHGSAKFEKTGHGPALIGLDADGHAKWHAHLDKRYEEHRGKFRPEIA